MDVHPYDFVLLVPVHQEYLDEGWEAFQILNHAVCAKLGVANVMMELVAMAEPAGSVERFYLGGIVSRVDRRSHRYAVATPTKGHRG